MSKTAFWAFAVLATSAGCGSQVDRQGGDNGASGPPAAAQGGAEGQFRQLAPPGARVSGDSFASADSPDKILSWYWNPDRPMFDRDGDLWTVSKPERRGEGYLVRMTIVDDEDGHTYAVYIDPRTDGGTLGRIRPITDEEIKSGLKL